MDNTSDIEKLISKYKSIMFAKEHLKKITARIEEQQSRLEELEGIVEKEYNDVRVLEKISLRSIFHKTLAKDNSRYEKEKEEYLLSILQFQECQKIIDLLVYEQKVLIEKVKKEAVIQTKLEELVAYRKEQIIEKFPKNGKQIIDIENRLKEKINERKEFSICKKKGKKVLVLIDKMIDLLNQAKHSGNWGENITLQKHQVRFKNDNMDKAQDLSHKTKQILQALQDDLEQIIPNSANLKIPEFDTAKNFNDIYYNNLISDWVVHTRIINSLEYLKSIKTNMNNLIKKLQAQITFLDHRITYLKSRKNELLLKL